MKQIAKIIGLVFIATLTISCSQGTHTMNKTTVFPKGNKGPKEIFSNTTWVKMLHTDKEGTFDTQVYNVTFEPAARTYWHSHPTGIHTQGGRFCSLQTARVITRKKANRPVH